MEDGLKSFHRATWPLLPAWFTGGTRSSSSPTECRPPATVAATAVVVVVLVITALGMHHISERKPVRQIFLYRIRQHSNKVKRDLILANKL
jgi:succinate dehydrogenase hydrophobic anchor subunit